MSEISKDRFMLIFEFIVGERGGDSSIRIVLETVYFKIETIKKTLLRIIAF